MRCSEKLVPGTEMGNPTGGLLARQLPTSFRTACGFAKNRVDMDDGKIISTETRGRAPRGAGWLGGHTGYHDGLVLGIGLEVGAIVTAHATGGRQLVLRAGDLGEEEVCDLGDLQAIGTSSRANYAIGVGAAFESKPGGNDLGCGEVVL